MENFEINESGTLISYSNSDKMVESITVPDGVTAFSYNPFKGYDLKKVILPDSMVYFHYYDFLNETYPPRSTTVNSITYRGIVFNPHLDNAMYIHSVLEMIRDKDYSHVLKHELKFPTVLQIYFKDGDAVTEAYIKKNLRKFFDFLCGYSENSGHFMGLDLYGASRTDPIETLKKLLETGKFITKRNIKTYIKTADETENSEFFDILSEYQDNL